MTDTLDRKKKYSEVSGDSRAAYYQAGKYYAPDGSRISDEEAGMPTESGSFMSQVESRVLEERAKENEDRPLTLVDETNPSTNRAVDIEKARERAAARGNGAAPETQESTPETQEAPVEPQEAPTGKAEQEAMLNGMHYLQIRKMVTELGLAPATGTGARAANVQLILENTE